MNVANLELCKELYVRSGWQYGMPVIDGYPLEIVGFRYDLGFLLGKLPEGIVLTNRNGWLVQYEDFLPSRNQVIHANAPEDAAAKLAIEMFKQGILKKEPA